MQIESHLGEVASTLAAQGLESSQLALDLILHDLADRARMGTGASGAAIALERNGVVVCRAAAGATVPDLGVRINTESGLTGACIRGRKRQWCSDTETDPRVDPDACRQLGVRSIVVVPLFLGSDLVGVFEIFAPQADAFGERDLTTLQDLGQWVTEALQSSVGKATAPPVSAPAPAPTSARTVEPVSYPEQAVIALAEQPDHELPAVDQSTRILRAVVLALATVLCLLLGFRWGWQRAYNDRAPQAAPTVAAAESHPTEAVPEETTPETTPAKLRSKAVKPSAGSQRKHTTKNDAGGLVVFQDGNIVYQQKPAAGGPEGQPTNVAGETAKTDSVSSAAQASPETQNVPTKLAPEQQVVASLPRSSLSTISPGITLPSPSVAAPVLAPRVSQGVTGGKLLHRVDPIYPYQAKQQHIDGDVVLQARIGKDGRVAEVKAVRGNAFLANAAVAAVRQWRYEPYKLNGDPVDMQAEIVIKFALP
ncbi:MAG TPA: TonB family protein [Terriglobales bacterium]|nr:TonB family protein [Terriglobales bacterium]